MLEPRLILSVLMTYDTLGAPASCCTAHMKRRQAPRIRAAVPVQTPLVENVSIIGCKMTGGSK